MKHYEKVYASDAKNFSCTKEFFIYSAFISKLTPTENS